MWSNHVTASLEPRPIHPFFVKPPPPVPSKLSPEQPNIQQEGVIEILDDVSASNASPHSPPAPPSLSQECGSQEDPIILDTSPVKPIRVHNSGASKPLAPLFAFRLPKASSAQTPQSPKETHLDAPYPDRTFQHVRGPQKTFPLPRLLYGRREKSRTPKSGETLHEILGPLNRDLNKSDIFPPTSHRHTSPSTSIHTFSNLTTVAAEEQHCPAITRVIAQSTASSSTHRLWADRWRPTRAAEVLGNEDNATYLRDWIQALELHLRTDATSEADENTDRKVRKAKAKDDARGIKRPRVVRAVEKRRGRKKRRIDSDDEDNWTVYSDLIEEVESIKYDDLNGYSEGGQSIPPPHDDSNIYMPSSPIPAPAPEHVARHSFDPLTNTIILVGPPGSGKTAAAYACAEELGWDVFEVYPGIGKRNGPGIDNLIGDAGKNHHVRKTRTGNLGSSSEGRSALSKLCKSSKEEAPTELDAEDAHSEDFGFVSPHLGSGTETAPVVRQSLILLEEVDILFKEDANFWPAVTNFIKDCRRPVICTCNDIALIPTQDLPLQAILNFQACPLPLAVSYLQGRCSAEGYTLERNLLSQMYKDSVPKLDPIDNPDITTPGISGEVPAPDLRRTINRLQFLCSSADSEIERTSGWEHLSDPVEDLCDWDWSLEPKRRKLADGPSADQGLPATVMRTEAPPGRVLAARHAELISFVDSHLMRSAWDTQEALAWSNCVPSIDDEVGHPILFCARTAESDFGLRTRDGEMASAAMWHSRGALETGKTREPTSVCISSFRTRELFRARVDHQLEMAKALSDIVSLPMLAMRRGEVYLDYVSRIRDIVAAEDRDELLHRLQAQGAGRMTRNSGGVYVRMIELTTASRAALARTVLEI
ncbi:hypothetical protein D9615_000415 [Tricholomella constricta]|uniref:AAA+ ATPase domain-containing protein n=1 Tax=Tricholomella constricta TaxID=117010 RepID=A0A8H5MBH3_9AGAR|nr:hypothetical protein D9615_000415 [Tricholomella constricta]